MKKKLVSLFCICLFLTSVSFVTATYADTTAENVAKEVVVNDDFPPLIPLECTPTADCRWCGKVCDRHFCDQGGEQERITCAMCGYQPDCIHEADHNCVPTICNICGANAMQCVH